MFRVDEVKLRWSFILAFLFLGGLAYGGVSDNSAKVCIGTEWGNSRPEKEDNTDKHYNSLKERYTNCTFVEGNLEISWLQNPNYDLSFLSNITEVTGYVLVLFVYVDVVPLNNLRVIRGKNLYNGHALYVALNYHLNVPDIGLQELQMPNLNEIIRGSIFFHNNDRLCYIHTIQWDDLQPNIVVESQTSNNHVECNNDTSRCHESCESGSCWGQGPDMCQILTLKTCSNTCDYRCRGTTPADCCHRSCAAGCRDSTNRGCFACRNFANDDECVSRCPSRYIYNPETFQTERNENFKFSYEFRCLDQCPADLVENGDNCVKHCPPGKIEKDKKCEECDGECVPEKVCVLPAEDEFLYESSFYNNDLVNCTKIAGNIIIGTTSFSGDLFEGKRGLTMEHLKEFSTVREITGYLSIQAPSQVLRNLSFFSNLERIMGRNLYNYEGFARCSLHITHTQLEVLPFKKLYEIAAGDVYVANNERLCYASEANFENIFTHDDQFALVEDNNPDCAAEGKVCHEECKVNDGCWGPLPTECVKCANAQYNHTCLSDCLHSDTEYKLYTADEGIPGVSPSICQLCHEECKSGCSGPHSDDCTALVESQRCKNVQDGPFCLSVCPDSKFIDENNICQPCHPSCAGGCTGQANTIGPGGCNSCRTARVSSDGSAVTTCVSRCPASRPHLTDQGVCLALEDENLPTTRPVQVCYGTERGVLRPDVNNEDEHYNSMKERYSNCTYVEGNLEISWLQNPNYDLSFLSNITEVTGYVLVLFVYADVVPLNNLRVIRGKNLYDGHALYVALNYHIAMDNIGLKQLEMPKLNEIIRGNVHFFNNYQLCYVHTIQWDDLQPNIAVEFDISENDVDCNTDEYRCHESCESGSCWGPGPDKCQILTLKTCNERCDYRCRGTTPADCCHGSCVAGCRDSTPSGCFACRSFINDDECVSQCPPRYIYNRRTFQRERNENFKFSYEFRCLDQCPDNVVEHGDFCVKNCPPGMTEKDGKCKECDGDCIGEKVCILPTEDEYLYGSSFTNNDLVNCTKIVGNIIIGAISFRGDIFEGKLPLHMDHLMELSTVREITGFLAIQAPYVNLGNISFFRNLEKIWGRNLYNHRSSFVLSTTSVEFLNLQKLKVIGAGDVYVMDNDNLCYVNEQLFRNIVPSDSSVVFQGNKDEQSCAADGKVCHEECKSDEGCWGPLPTQCGKCANAQYEDTCLSDCHSNNTEYLLYTADEGTPGVSPKICQRCSGPICQECHPECIGCEGPGPTNCKACRHVQRGERCVSSCDAQEFVDAHNNCQACHRQCDGCYGPSKRDCKECSSFSVFDEARNITTCVSRCPASRPHFTDHGMCLAQCPEGHYNRQDNRCIRCHDQCKGGCIDDTSSGCHECRFVNQGGSCRQNCTIGWVEDRNRTCVGNMTTETNTMENENLVTTRPVQCGVLCSYFWNWLLYFL